MLSFNTKVVAKAKKRQVGDPLNEATEQGPQVNEVQADRVMELIEAGQKQGAELLTGGKRLDRKGYFVEPTVFGNV